MATVTGYTAARMKAIEDGTVVGGTVASNGHLMLTKHDGTQVDAGGVQAPYAIQVVDTPGIDLQLTGAGVPGNPWSLKALIAPVEMTLGTNLNAMVTTGMWMASDQTIANSLINWPVEAIPRLDNSDANNAPGSYRGGCPGTLTVVAHPTGRIEQTAELLTSTGVVIDVSGYTNGVMPLVYKRSRSLNGTTWGAWIYQGGPISIATYAEREYLTKQYLLGMSARSPVRCFFAFGPVGAQNGGWSAPFEAMSVDGIQWWDPLSRNRAATTGYTNLTWQNGFSDYVVGAGWPTISAIRTSAGIILVRGLGTRASVPASGTTIATLPPGMRPSAKMMFAGPSTSNLSACQIIVQTDGQIIFYGTPTANLGFIDFSCIIFPAADVAPNSAWTPVTFGSGWIQFTGDSLFGVPSYWQDKFGRVWFRGMVQGSPTGTADSTMFSVPLALAPVLQVHNAVPSSQAVGAASTHFIGAAGVTQFVFKSGQTAMTNGWVSLSQFFLHPVAQIPETLWRTIILANGWIRYPSNTFPIQAIWTAPDGISHLRGLIQGGNTPPTSVSVSMGANDRPNLSVMYLANSNSVMARYTINAGLGDYTIAANTGSTTWYSLDGGHYMTEA